MKTAKEEEQEKKILGNLLESRKPIYKNVKMAMAHCPICGEMLSGNNSLVNPLKCKCGIWEFDWRTNNGYYRIKLNPQ